MNKKTKKILIASSCGAFGVGAFLALAGNYFVNVAIKRGKHKYSNKKRREKAASEKDPAMLKSMLDSYRQMYKRSRLWLSETEHEIINLKTFDNLHLYGELFRHPDSDKYVILSHGYTRDHTDMYIYGPYFYERGFNVLIFDQRAHGKSDGDFIGMGWLERLDIKKWCEYIVEQNENARIVLFGQSMGASSVLMACGEEDIPSNVRVCISDSAYSSVKEIYKKLMNTVYHIPSFPILNTASVVAKKKAGYSFFEADTIGQVQKSNIPTLFIHAQGDTFVPFENLHRLYDACNAPKALYSVPDADHVYACFYDRETYFKRVFDFIEKYI